MISVFFLQEREKQSVQEKQWNLIEKRMLVINSETGESWIIYNHNNGGMVLEMRKLELSVFPYSSFEKVRL